MFIKIPELLVQGKGVDIVMSETFEPTCIYLCWFRESGITKTGLCEWIILLIGKLGILGGRGRFVLDCEVLIIAFIR